VVKVRVAQIRLAWAAPPSTYFVSLSLGVCISGKLPGDTCADGCCCPRVTQVPRDPFSEL
jgi:hypothetical protein